MQFPQDNVIEREFPSDTAVLPQVEEFVRSCIQSLIGNTPESNLYNVFLVATEAANNAIVHGNKSSAQETFLCRVAYSNDLLWLQTHDTGKGFDPDELPDPTSPENLLASGGRGIFLIRSFCTHFLVQHNGTHNVVTMALQLGE